MLESAGVKDGSNNITSHMVRFKRQTATVNSTGTTWSSPQTPFQLTLYVSGASSGNTGERQPRATGGYLVGSLLCR